MILCWRLTFFRAFDDFLKDTHQFFTKLFSQTLMIFAVILAETFQLNIASQSEFLTEHFCKASA